MNLLRECEGRLRWGIPLRLDQTVGLLAEGIDVGTVEEELLFSAVEVDHLSKEGNHNG